MLVGDIGRIVSEARLPALPEMYFKLDAASRDVACTPETIGAIVSQDNVIEEHLLRLVNSALFEFSERVDTVPHAVEKVGIPQIRDLALSIMIIRMLDGIDPDIVSMKSYWRHSFACGITARILATLRGEPNVERFFVAGLLHDIGSLLFYLHIPEQAMISVLHGRDDDGPLYLQEREVVGFDHAMLGKAVLRDLQMPEAMQEAVEFHHTPDQALNYPVDAAVLHVADIIVNAMQYGSRGEFIVAPLSPDAWDRLGLSVSILPQVIEQVDRQFNCMVRVFFGKCCGVN